jgi:hypothetical protein
MEEGAVAWNIKEVYIQCKTSPCPATQTSAYRGPSTEVYTIKGQVPKIRSCTDKHEGKEKDRQQHLTELLTIGIALRRRTKVAAPVEAAALEGLDVVPFVSVCELDVEQQVGNTCAPRRLITALEGIYCPTELEATSFKDIDQKAKGVGAEWLKPHLDAPGKSNASS